MRSMVCWTTSSARARSRVCRNRYPRRRGASNGKRGHIACSLLRLKLAGRSSIHGMKPTLKKLGTTIAAIAVGAAATLVATPAQADQSVDWSKVLVEVDHYVRSGQVESAQP